MLIQLYVFLKQTDRVTAVITLEKELTSENQDFDKTHSTPEY